MEDPAALPSGKELVFPTKWDGWAPQQVRTFRASKEYSSVVLLEKPSLQPGRMEVRHVKMYTAERDFITDRMVQNIRF